MREAIVEKVRAAGVVGAGGAGFPTHVKLQSEVSRVLANGASCEPLLKSDPYLMEHFTDLILDGLNKVIKCTEADQGTICLKAKHKKAVAKLKDSINNGSYAHNTDIFELENFYPAGDEFVLVAELLGKTVPEGGIPLDVSTLVSNVETLLNISRAMAGQPVTDRYLTICGEVRNPVICKVPIGTPASEVVTLAGGSTLAEYALVMGGPMMGLVLQNINQPVTKTTSGLIVLPPNHNVVQDKQKDLKRMRSIAKSACTQCSHCTELCPRNLIGHNIAPHKIMRHLAYTPGMTGEILSDALICSGCGICEKFACPMMLSPREINMAVKEKLIKEGVKRKSYADQHQISSFFNTRKVPTNRLMERLGVTSYDLPLPFYEDKIRSKEVRIPTLQHIGDPALPVVKVGDKVRKGDLIGEIPQGKLGARVHASIDGTVTRVEDTITICDL